MKKIFLICICTILTFALGLAQSPSSALESFLSGTPIEKEKATSISNINEVAKQKASQTISLTKENIAEALKSAQAAKMCIIVVENHTIVKFSDIKNCKTSGSWGVCMPYGEGFIQHGGLTSVNDYINNIIGKPDAQMRTLYLFN